MLNSLETPEIGSSRSDSYLSQTRASDKQRMLRVRTSLFDCVYADSRYRRIAVFRNPEEERPSSTPLRTSIERPCAGAFYGIRKWVAVRKGAVKFHWSFPAGPVSPELVRGQVHRSAGSREPDPVGEGYWNRVNPTGRGVIFIWLESRGAVFPAENGMWHYRKNG